MIQLQSRTKVLLIGPCSDPTLRELADITSLPGRDYDEQRVLIEQAVAEKGPFDVFGVSPPSTSITPITICWISESNTVNEGS